MGMFRWTYSARVGPCTCSRFLTVSSGNTAVFAVTLARMPASASPEPIGSDMPARGSLRDSYDRKKRPMYGTIPTTAAERPLKNPMGPSRVLMSRMLESRLWYTLSFPCAANRVRSRSSGYVRLVAMPPASAPLTKDSVESGSRYGGGNCWRKFAVFLYIENCSAPYVT